MNCTSFIPTSMQEHQTQVTVIFGTISAVLNKWFGWLSAIKILGNKDELWQTIVSAVIGACAAYFTTKILKFIDLKIKKYRGK